MTSPIKLLSTEHPVYQLFYPNGQQEIVKKEKPVKKLTNTIDYEELVKMYNGLTPTEYPQNRGHVITLLTRSTPTGIYRQFKKYGVSPVAKRNRTGLPPDCRMDFHSVILPDETTAIVTVITRLSSKKMTVNSK